ncbi:ImmA/IrrE family metallo-endopeptidase [Kitasatospora fiedleri]|uniref:ImmA/IrrE family metallo-endopeptidase n=1 Tax=Kitasatospora fiedleri TaxID=2991545 RepID=UPI00249C5578|nr:ImmA/IrrE family metallo-endopeptidase [Kitasatospora fiedleri]
MPIAAGVVGLMYNPAAELEEMGIPILRCWLRDTWGIWSPERHAVVVADGLTPIEERCVLAHELEHVLAGDSGCGGTAGLQAERRAETRAARKLIALSDWARARQWAADEHELAAELNVTTWALRARHADLQGGAQWLGTSKIAG